MSLDASSVGYKTEVLEFEYDFRTTVLYALGIGIGQEELDFLYEGRGPRVFPTFAVVPAYAAMGRLLGRAGANLASVVHHGQSVRLHAEFPPRGRLSTVGTIDGVYDMKRLGLLAFSTATHLDGALVGETSWSILVRDGGAFGGPRPPKTEVPEPLDREHPSFEVTLETRPEQALLYRLSGDLNPLHADPDVARAAGFLDGPILHGLCTFGFVARAVIAGQCAGDASRLRALHVQFKKPVWPGDSIRTLGFQVDQSRSVVQSFAGGRPEPVVTNAWAELR